MSPLIHFCNLVPLDFVNIIVTDCSKFFFSIKVLLKVVLLLLVINKS